MKVTLWGARGSIATPGPRTIRYGGNTSCVKVEGADGSILVLDAGTGILRLNADLPQSIGRIDVLLSHLHLDHLQGLGFFWPLRQEGIEVHIWGPASTALSLRERLARFMSPPLFPVYMRDLRSRVILHEVARDEFEIGEFKIRSDLVVHMDPTLGFRVSNRVGTLAYLPDHEPALGTHVFPAAGSWTSGYDIAAGADLLMHDSQYTPEEYQDRVGWGHSSIPDAFAFAELTGVRHFVPFHHDPKRSDEELDGLFTKYVEACRPNCRVTPAMEGTVYVLDGAS